MLENFGRIRWAAAVAAVAVSVLVAGTAQAATVRLGSSLVGPTNFPGYGASTTMAITAMPAPGVVGSPVDGTVVSWSFIGNSSGPFLPRVLRPTGGVTYTGAGTGAGQTNVPTPSISGPFATSLPIRKNDIFAVDMPAGGSIAYKAAIMGATGNTWLPVVADNGPARTPTGTWNSEEEMISATVRYCLVPSLRGKSPADARKALAAADCTAGKFKKTKKKRKRRKVLSQSLPAGTSVSDTQPVDAKLSTKKK